MMLPAGKYALFEVAAVFQTDQGHEERTATALLMPCRTKLPCNRSAAASIEWSACSPEKSVATAADRVWSTPGADILARSPIGHVGLLALKNCGRPRAGRTVGACRCSWNLCGVATGNRSPPQPSPPSNEICRWSSRTMFSGTLSRR